MEVVVRRLNLTRLAIGGARDVLLGPQERRQHETHGKSLARVLTRRAAWKVFNPRVRPRFCGPGRDCLKTLNKFL
jgi:hypothetical protein